MTGSATRMPVAMPWVRSSRRAPMREKAAPLLLEALRRVAWIPIDGLFAKDAEAMDRGRVTGKRLDFVLFWHGLHPQGDRPMVHSLRHAGFVLKACGLFPSAFHQTLRDCDGNQTTSDADLLQIAYLSTVNVFTPEYGYTRRVLSLEWTIEDLINWSRAWDEKHYLNCLLAGFTHEEIQTMLRAGTVPDETDIGGLIALQQAERSA